MTMTLIRRIGHHKKVEEVRESLPEKTMRGEGLEGPPENKTRGLVTAQIFEFFNSFSDLPEVFPRSYLASSTPGFGPFGVDEFFEDGTLILRVALAGLDPDDEISITLEDDTLRIGAGRREEEIKVGGDSVRNEFRCGAFRHDLAVPTGTSMDDVEASYEEGVLEVRVALPVPFPVVPQRKVAVKTTGS